MIPNAGKKAKIPDEIIFQTKPQIALEQIRVTLSTQTPVGVILADAGYGADGGFRRGLTELGLTYAVGVQPTLSVWRPGEGPLPPKAWSGKGRPPKLMQRSADHQPLSAKASPKICRQMRGRPSRGARAAMSISRRALPLYVFVWPRGITISGIRATKNGSLSNGLKTTRNRSNTGFQPCRRRPRCRVWLPQPSRDGGLNGIIASSSRSWASATTKGEVGEDFTTTPVFASQLTGFSSPKGRRFPPQHFPTPKTAKNLPFPAVPDPANPPIRPERHTSNSIATLRRRLTVALARRLMRCPCCARAILNHHNL